MSVRTLDGKLLVGWVEIPSSLGPEDRETVGKTVGPWELEGNWEGFELGGMSVRTLDGKLLGGWVEIPSSFGTEDRETVGKTVGPCELEGNWEGIELVMLGVTDTVLDGIALDDTSVGK